MTISPSSGHGSATSSTLSFSGPPNSLNCATRIVVSLLSPATLYANPEPAGRRLWHKRAVKSQPGSTRGYFAIGIEGVSKAVNLGNLLRATRLQAGRHRACGPSDRGSDLCPPAQAAYVLGPKRGVLSPEILARCQHLVRIPTAFSLNLAMTACAALLASPAARSRKVGRRNLWPTMCKVVPPQKEAGLTASPGQEKIEIVCCPSPTNRDGEDAPSRSSCLPLCSVELHASLRR